MGARDFFGNPIPSGPAYDIGASEFTPPASSSEQIQLVKSETAFDRALETAELLSLTRGPLQPLTHRGRWTLLTLSSSPCGGESTFGALRSQKPFLQSARRQFGAAGLDVGIVLARPSCEVDDLALSNLPYDWALDGVELLFDDSRDRVAAMLRQGSTMTTVLVNPASEVVACWSGFVLPQQLGIELQKRLGPPLP